MSISYKFKKMIVRIKQRNKLGRERRALKPLSVQQLKVYHTVIDLAIHNQKSIKFDRETDEIMMFFPHKLITIVDNTVRIDNTNKFYPINFPTEAFDIMVKIVSREGHRERRRLKHEVKVNINNFLNEVANDGNFSLNSEMDEDTFTENN